VRSGVEVALTRYAKANRLRVQHVPLSGVTHVMKEEKLGALRGAWGRLRMYCEIAACIVRDGHFRRTHRGGAATRPAGSGRES